MKLLTTDNVKLGFIGLGNMGSRIARRLLNHGYHLIAYDRDRAKADAMGSDGALVANSIAELSQSADVILSCLTNDEAVHDVYYGDAGVLASARPGTFVFEMSTVFPETSRELYQRGDRHGIKVLDVAISGSTPAAEQGNLILLVGGAEGLFQVAQPLFGTISARSFHVGPAGSGTTMKLVVNTLLGVGMQAIAEAIPLGEKAGIERNLARRSIADSCNRTGSCWQAPSSGATGLQPAVSPQSHAQRLWSDPPNGEIAERTDASNYCGISR